MPRILLCQKSLSRGCSPLLLLLLLSVVSRLRGSAAAAFVGSSHLHRHPQQAITTTAQHQYGCFASSGLLFGKQPRHALHLSAPESSPDVGGSSAEADDTETIGSSNNSGSSGESTDDDDVVTEVTATEGDEPMVAAVVVENEEQQEAVGLLKQEIAALEAELKATRRQVADVSDRADEYTKSGYARAVAEMENMRRARSVRTNAHCSLIVWMGACREAFCFRTACWLAGCGRSIGFHWLLAIYKLQRKNLLSFLFV